MTELSPKQVQLLFRAHGSQGPYAIREGDCDDLGVLVDAGLLTITPGPTPLDPFVNPDVWTHRVTRRGRSLLRNRVIGGVPA